MSGRRYPLAPLARQVELRDLPDERGLVGLCSQCVMVFEVHRHTVMRWQKHGLTQDAADRAAHKLGLHPMELWDEWGEA